LVLSEQEFVFEPKKTVQQVLKDAEIRLQSPIIINKFLRIECGEGIEKKEDDFAAEVQKISKS
jgi:elongation factor Ts